MYEITPELTSDLEWMLQSGQAPEDLLLEALVEHFYQPVHHLALTLLDDQKAAQRAALLTLANALAEQYNYRDHIGVNSWVFGFAIDACYAILDGRQIRQPIQNKGKEPDLAAGTAKTAPEKQTDSVIWPIADKLNRQTRTVVMLTYIAGWGINEICQVLKMEPAQVTLRLEAARGSFENALVNITDDSPDSPNNLKLEKLETTIRESLLRRWPPSDISQQTLYSQVKRIAKLAGRSSARQRGISHLKEIVIVSIIILAITGITWGANTFWPEPEVSPITRPTELVTKIVYITRMVKPSATPTPAPTQIPEGILYLVQIGDTLESVSAALGTTIETLRVVNRIPADAKLQEGLELLIPNSLRVTPPAATRVPPARHVLPLRAPYTSLEILQRLKLGDDLFNTLWFDAIMVDYGPAAYIGPARMRRVQVWLSIDQILVIIGTPDDQVEEVWLMQGEALYMANPSADQFWFVETQANSAEQYQGLERLFLTILGNNDLRSGIVEGVTLSAVERSNWAGQQVLIVDEISGAGSAAERRQARLWIDDRTGLILRKQWYAVENPSIMTQDISLLAIAYDIDFPQELFDPRLPWRGGFAVDHSGEPAALNDPVVLPYQEPRTPVATRSLPDDYNPAGGNLTFEYPADFLETENQAPILLYADHYLLGWGGFGNPWRLICQRSPDGERIAYVSQPPRSTIQASPIDWLGLDPQNPDPLLHWFSLVDFPEGQRLLRSPLIAVTQFAWAPDSRRLAVFGYEPGAASGAIYIVDSDQSNPKKLIELDDANSLVWHPDGKRLAMIARYYPGSYEEQIIILDTQSGEISDFIPLDTQSGHSDDWPFESWDVIFPTQMGGLQACAVPVEK